MGAKSHAVARFFEFGAEESQRVKVGQDFCGGMFVKACKYGYLCIPGNHFKNAQKRCEIVLDNCQRQWQDWARSVIRREIFFAVFLKIQV